MAAYALVGTFALLRVVSTLQTFSATIDEPTHVACGSDWLNGRPYRAADNPPLARILAGLPSWLAGIPSPPVSGDEGARGDEILYSRDYVRNVARSRLGSVLFFAAAMVGVGWWAVRRFGPSAGLIAVTIFAWLPPIRAHAGLATTDMAAVAAFPLAIALLDRWLDAPTIVRGFALGAGIGVGAIAKFSFLVFFAIAAGILIGVRVARREAHVSMRSLAGATAVAMLIVWAAYRFETGTLVRAHPSTSYILTELLPRPARGPAMWFASKVALPAPLFFIGPAVLEADNQHGHDAFLFGEVRRRGWWYYFPVALFFKTPLPFLCFAIAGVVLVVLRERRALDVAFISIGVIASVLPVSIDIGVRHILPIYAPLSVAAAYAVLTMARSRHWRIAVVPLAVWMILGTEHAHPDYLAWFNEAAGSHPERILADSNLDWGQDYLRLVRVLHDRGIDDIYLLPCGSVQLWRDFINARRIQPRRVAPGWYVVSETGLAMDPDARSGAYQWLVESRSFERIGKTIRLYHVS
jgi:hypothetical protein